MIAFSDAAKCSCIKNDNFEATTPSNFSESDEFLTTNEKEILSAHSRGFHLDDIFMVDRMLERFTENRSAEEHFVGYVRSS